MEESIKGYNIGILKQVQAIFGHLAYSILQYYIPRGLWKHFKLQREPVNLREQQDAVEFFMSLVESIDEALKALGQEQIMSKILGGSYSDQKICKGCPHRYSKEEPFSVISVDIRYHSNLLDSLEQYVKGELLEGADAYHCDKCNKKVVTVKRLCVKKLPPILAIQLQRFEYDFERVCAIKFNDYFEFPRHLDMDPYTTSGLANLEGEMIDCDYDGKDVCTKYQLTGIVVHSGQASGGHYYSYILHRQNDGTSRWYKFDDGEVSECKMEDEKEMKTQCFGGDYMGEVFDHMLKRMRYRRQKRWWNAYMLFYTQIDVEESNLVKSFNELYLYSKLGVMKMPPAIEQSVRWQNTKFMHNRNQFSAEYFHFMRRLACCNAPTTNRQHNADKLYLESLVSPSRRGRQTGTTLPVYLFGRTIRKRFQDAVSRVLSGGNVNTTLSPAVSKQRSSVNDAGLLSVSGSFLDCTPSPCSQLSDAEVESVSSETPRKSPYPRHRVFLELLQTETNYVNILNTIMTLFKTPLEEMCETDGQLLNRTELKIIFGHLPLIYQTHCQILEQLKWAASHWTEDVSIGNIFLEFSSDFVKVYPPFVNFFENTRETLLKCDQSKRRFHAFLKIGRTKPECGRQSLHDLLICPVQRLPSTLLLLNDILKHTGKSNPDHSALEQAVSSIHEVLTHINEDKRKTAGQIAECLTYSVKLISVLRIWCLLIAASLQDVM